MKRLTFLIALGALLATGMFLNYGDSEADNIYPYSNTFTWTLTHDSTVGNFPNADTLDSLSGLSGSKIFRYDGVGNASNIRGLIWAEMTGYDTNNAGALMDSAEDTAAFLIYSGFSAASDTVWLVYKDSLLSANTYEGAVHFNIPSDSVIGDFIYFEFISMCADSSQADSSSSLTYKATVIMKAIE